MGSDEPNPKRVRLEEHKSKKTAIRPAQKTRTKPEGSNLRAELEAPGVPVLKDWKSNPEDRGPFSNENLPKIRLPKQVAVTPTQFEHVTQAIQPDIYAPHESNTNGSQVNGPIYLAPAQGTTVGATVAVTPTTITPQFQIQAANSAHQGQLRYQQQPNRGNQRYTQTAGPSHILQVQPQQLEQSGYKIDVHENSGHFSQHGIVLGNGQAATTVQAAPLFQQTNPKQIYWVPCVKTETENGPEYQKIPDMQVHVSQYGSQELRPVQQRESLSPQRQNQAQVPVTLSKEVSYSPITDHVSYILNYFKLFFLLATSPRNADGTFNWNQFWRSTDNGTYQCNTISTKSITCNSTHSYITA